jgi:hypothetical protein
MNPLVVVSARCSIAPDEAPVTLAPRPMVGELDEYERRR